MKKINKKLSLNKETITKLNDNELNSLNGGADSVYTLGLRCVLRPTPKPAPKPTPKESDSSYMFCTMLPG